MQHGRGGILIYAHSSIESEQYNVISSAELMWIKQQSKNPNSIFINASYVPPISATAYIDELKKYITTDVDCIHASFHEAPLFFAGDFNRMCVEDLELKCCITYRYLFSPTCGDAHLDIVLTNMPDCIEDIVCQ